MPENNLEISNSIGSSGLSKQPWWVEQWLELINSYPLFGAGLDLVSQYDIGIR